VVASVWLFGRFVGGLALARRVAPNPPVEFCRGVNRWVSQRCSTHSTDKGTQKSPARFPGRAHFVSFNFLNTPIRVSTSRHSEQMG
jgi:hypothetical protein